ncbi:MAG: aminotransferase class I/II-fold pyridoxal phosphate-dependent enzyme [Bradymonadia bacterium]
MRINVAQWVNTELKRLEQQHRRRWVVTTEPSEHRSSGARQGREMVLFSTNDYLGLANDPRVVAGAQNALNERGMGTRSASLISGYSELHESLENELAQLKDQEAALVMSSGYQANVGLLSAIGTDETIIFSDALNHASIIDGCRLSKAQVQVYRHRDMDHLEDLLKRCSARRRVVVTDEVFSMDGHRAPLVELAALRARYGFILITDSAHSTGIYGNDGAGLCDAAGVTESVDFQVGTLSKSLGSHGGFVACSSKGRDWLLNTARAYIFSTALPVPCVGAALAAIDVMRTDPAPNRRLWTHITALTKALRRPPTGPIVPFIIGQESATMDAAAHLQASGLHVPAIRPPTVPPDTCRLRLSLSAAHTRADIERLIKALQESPAWT